MSAAGTIAALVLLSGLWTVIWGGRDYLRWRRSHEAERRAQRRRAQRKGAP